jgi:hypothetical protein
MQLTSLLLVFIAATTSAFQPVHRFARQQQTRLQAVELPTKLASAPTTFLKCVEQAVVCVKKAMENGDKLMEVGVQTQHVDKQSVF